MLNEHVFVPFVLDRTSKVNVQLAGNLELKGEGWRCGLKTFSLDKKWSLINDEITIVYTNGYKSVLKPKITHSVHELDKILDEMFGNTRVKRGDIFDEMMNNDKPSEKEKEKKETEITPPSSVMPFDFDESPKSPKTPVKEVTPPASVMPFDLNESPKSPKTPIVQPPPSLVPLEPKFIAPKKLDIEISDTDSVKMVTLPTDEDGKIGEKVYLVYKLFKDAFYYSPELPPAANIFTKKGFESVNFTFNSNINRYEVTFDDKFVRGIHFSNGFSEALGFKQIIFNNTIAPNPPKVENLHSHIHIYVNNVICPTYCGQLQETILDILPVTPDPNPISKTYERPNYLRILKNRIDTIEIEFKDIHGNPIYGSHASGHLLFEFTKFSK